MSKTQCTATNRNGERCRAFAGEGEVCFMHDEARGKEKAMARRKGGLATKKPHFADAKILPSSVRTIESVLIVLDYALRETVGLDNSVQRGRLLVAIANGYIEALKVGEMEARLEAVETVLKLRKREQRNEKGNNKWQP